MAKADLVFLENLDILTEEGTWDENPRPKYKDGESAHSRFITDVYVKYKADITPIISLRHTAWKTGIKEIVSIYQKQTSNLSELEALGVNWWDSWVINKEDPYEDQYLGIRYGATVKKWDLMNKLLDGLVNDPFSRRHIVNLYQESDLQETDGLHPCAFLTEWSCRRTKDGKMHLDMSLTQRSSDFGTAYSINQVQYKAFQMMVACHCGYEVGTFSHHVMNLHGYDRHGEPLSQLVLAGAKLPDGEPKLVLNAEKGTNFYDIDINDFKMINYNPVVHEQKLEFELAI